MDAETRFWQLAAPLLGTPGVDRSTMMGYPCLQLHGAFFASLEPPTGHLVVKLPADRVAELVGTGGGLAFAPAGRAFREWVAVPSGEPDTWRALLDEAHDFAASSKG